MQFAKLEGKNCQLSGVFHMLADIQQSIGASFTAQSKNYIEGQVLMRQFGPFFDPSEPVLSKPVLSKQCLFASVD